MERRQNSDALNMHDPSEGRVLHRARVNERMPLALPISYRRVAASAGEEQLAACALSASAPAGIGGAVVYRLPEHPRDASYVAEEGRLCNKAPQALYQWLC